MKKLAFVFAGILVAVLLYTYGTVKANEKQDAGSYVIIRYTPYLLGFNTQYVLVNDGASLERIPLTRQESIDIGGYMVRLLNKYDEKGYELISTSGDTKHINCFLRKKR